VARVFCAVSQARNPSGAVQLAWVGQVGARSVVRHHRGSVFRLSSRRVLASPCALRATRAGSKELRGPGWRPVIHRNLSGFSVTQQCIDDRLTSCRHPGSTHAPVAHTNTCPVCSAEQAQCPLGHQQPFGTSCWRSNCAPPCAAKHVVSPLLHP
jgi:hypothetical protein